jgi:hypothetical protein
VYLKNEIKTIVTWRIEILDETVAAEIAALPADMQARFCGLLSASPRWGWKASVSRMSNTWKGSCGSCGSQVATELLARFTSRRLAEEWSWSARL